MRLLVEEEELGVNLIDEHLLAVEYDSLAALLPRDLRVDPRLPSVLVLKLNFVLQALVILKVEEFERLLDLKPVDEQVDLHRLCHREAEQILLLVPGEDPLLGDPGGIDEGEVEVEREAVFDDQRRHEVDVDDHIILEVGGLGLSNESEPGFAVRQVGALVEV